MSGGEEFGGEEGEAAELREGGEGEGEGDGGRFYMRFSHGAGRVS